MLFRSATQLHVTDKIDLKGTAATTQKIDKEKAYQILFAGVKIKDQYEEEITGRDEETDVQYYYEGQNMETLNISSEGVNYRGSLSGYVDNCFDLSAGGNLDKYKQDTNLEFAAWEEVFSDIKEKLEQMGYRPGELEYDVYALDYETMQKEEYAMDMDGNEDTSIYKDNWSKEDECYFFSIRQKVQNLPEYHPYANLFKSPSAENAPIQVLYSKDGIQHLEIEKIYDFTENKENITLKPFEEIASKVAYKYNQLLTGAEYIVTDATLYYMTEHAEKNMFQMMPVWIFNVEETIENNGEKIGRASCRERV